MGGRVIRRVYPQAHTVVNPSEAIEREDISI